MSIVIEKITVVARNKKGCPAEEFIPAIRDMKVGQSFLVRAMDSNNRSAISIAQVLLPGRKYCCRREGKMIRVGRVS